MVNQKGHQKMPVANSHSVGPQGTGGPVAGSEIYAVKNPRGMTAKKIGGGMGSLEQGPIQPKVGK